MPKLSSGNPAFDMALIASGTDAVVIGIPFTCKAKVPV
jgi:hypothetical protein